MKIFISYKVNNEIITNSDIEKENQIFNTLNNQLKTLDKKKVLNYQKNRIKRKNKKNRIVKFFDLKK